MKIPKLIILLLIVCSCKQKNVETKTDIKPIKLESKILTQKFDSVSEKYKLEKIESFDWSLVSKRAGEYEVVSIKYSEKKLIPKDFFEFANSFISNPKFQKEHIDFEKLIAVVGACEATYVLKKNNWVYDDWNFVQYIGIDEKMENTFHHSDSIFYCEYIIKEVGTIRILGFEKKDGKWNLTLYNVNNC